MKWKEIVIEAFNYYNGEANLLKIYNYVETYHKESLTRSYKSSIRSTIERFSSDSKVFTNKEDLFYSVKGIGKGVWALR